MRHSQMATLRPVAPQAHGCQNGHVGSWQYTPSLQSTSSCSCRSKSFKDSHFLRFCSFLIVVCNTLLFSLPEFSCRYRPSRPPPSLQFTSRSPLAPRDSRSSYRARCQHAASCSAWALAFVSPEATASRQEAPLAGHLGRQRFGRGDVCDGGLVSVIIAPAAAVLFPGSKHELALQVILSPIDPVFPSPGVLPFPEFPTRFP